MSLNIKYIGFNGWPTFKNTSILTKLLKNYEKIVENVEESNVLVIGSFINIIDLNTILNYKGKKILYISEPIQYLEFTQVFYFLFKNKIYDYALGSIEHNKEKNWYKYPIYNCVCNLYDSEIYQRINQYVLEVDIFSKKFCTLISRHDLGNCRLKTYEIVKQYGHIDCPGALLNNMSNEYLEKVGIPEFIKDYIFNICNENFGESHSGYITEKIMNCCFGGAIPIYYGKLDDIDKKIFNINRIIVIENINDLNTLIYRLNEILKSNESLEKFYRQPVFQKNALEVLLDMKNHPINLLEEIRKSL